MPHILRTISIIGLATLLSSCALSLNSSSSMQIMSKKLASGKTTKIGWYVPKAAWKCKKITQITHNWAGDKFKGAFKLGGSQSVLREQAINYANQHHLDTNYIYLHVPMQTSLDGIDVTAASQATIKFYKCKHPPADQLF